MKKFTDKILALREFQSATGRNDLSLCDLSDSEIYDISEVMSYDDIKLWNDCIKKINNKGKDKMNNMDLLEKVTEAATFLYTKNFGDTVAPNILISRLPNRQYYVSLNRYATPGQERFLKTIVFKVTKTDLNKALLDVAKFLSKQKPTKTNPLEELEKLFDEPVPETLPPAGINYFR